MTAMTRGVVAGTAALTFMTLGSSAYADGRSYNDGPVINVSAVRTANGHFDDYMAWLASGWKKQMEAAKKAGLILSYDVLVAEPHNPTEPDVYLVIRYKNWAALDGAGSKFDTVAAQAEGSIDKANQGVTGRDKIRTILGSQTMQIAELK
jgi:hypothetical protein